jgi:Pregnancy-associated plasma protein-A
MKMVRLRRRHALLFALAAVAAVYTSFTVSPAAAAPSSGATVSSEFCGFSSVEALATSTTARGSDKAREPDLSEIAEEVPESAKGKGGKRFAATIPVYIHVITAGATGNVSQTTIDEQMGALNLSYGGFYGGAKTGFSFQLAGVTRTDNAAWHFMRAGSNDERAAKRALHQGGANALNIYTVDGGAFLGWAYYPKTAKNRLYLDGIVIDYRSMPGGPYGSQFSLGFTVTHEAGHWLNLAHTFDTGCSEHGDQVTDTPPERTPTSGCPLGKDTCTDPGADPIRNYMDYSWDSCYTEFTPGQTTRMQDAYLFFRA